MLTHVVLMTFVDESDRAKARELLEGLAGTIPAIRGLRVGLDVTGSAVSAHLCLITEHDDADGLRAYQEHPAHVEVAGWLRPRLAARTAVDFVDG